MIIDGIILDVDGTIWNTTSIVAKAWNSVIDKLYPNVKKVTADILKAQFGKPMNVIADNLFPELKQSDKNKLMDQCCIAEQKEIELNETDITYPTVLDTIKLLSKNYKLFIVSNCQSGYIELVMNKLYIEKYITDFECYGNTLKNKDENISLIITRNKLSNPIYVGDTQGDYEACKKAGVKFIWASYGFGSPLDNNYYGKINKLSDIIELL